MFPTQLHFQVNEQCNLRCPGCYLPERSSGGGSAKAIDATVFGPAAAAGAVFCTITGGEPLLHPEIVEICRLAAARFGHVLLVCNGTLLDAETVRSLREAGVAGARVSLDSVRPDVHDALRGKPGTFDIVTRNLQNAARAGLELGIITTINEANVQDMAGLARWAADNGLDRVAYQPYHPYGFVYPSMQDFTAPAYDAAFFAALESQLHELEDISLQHPRLVETPPSMLAKFPEFFQEPPGVKQVCGADRYLFVNSQFQVRGCLFCEPLASLSDANPAAIVESDAYGHFDAFRKSCQLCLMGCQYAGPETRALEAGWEAYRQGHLDEAAARFQESLEIFPGPEAELGLGLSQGWALVQAGDYAGAAGFFATLAKETGAAEADYGLGAALLWQEQTREARSLLERVAHRAPYLKSVFGDLATACRLLGDLKAAVEWGSKAVDVFPDSQYAHHQLGLTLREAKRETEALPHFATAAQLNPEHPWVRFDFGLSLWKHERHEEAVEEFEAALGLDASQPWFHMLLAHALKGMGRHDQARASALAALEKNAGADPVLEDQAQGVLCDNHSG